MAVRLEIDSRGTFRANQPIEGLLSSSMARRFPLGVVEVFIYRSQIGFRYNGRNEEGRIIYEKTQDFRSRFDVKREVMKRWPKARITYS